MTVITLADRFALPEAGLDGALSYDPARGLVLDAASGLSIVLAQPSWPGLPIVPGTVYLSEEAVVAALPAALEAAGLVVVLSRHEVRLEDAPPVAQMAVLDPARPAAAVAGQALLPQPAGWHPIGSYIVLTGAHLEYSAETDGSGQPLWERMVTLTCPVVDRRGRVRGCGASIYDVRDDEGWVDCGSCGMAFDPEHPNSKPASSGETNSHRRPTMIDIIGGPALLED